MRLTGAAVAIAAALFAVPLGAQDTAGDRCRILGPVAVSSWFGFLEAAGKGEREETRAAAATLEAVVSLYSQVGCPADRLELTLDCLSAQAMSGAMPGGPSAVATRCMADAGLPSP